jgi:hypothetical protein
MDLWRIPGHFQFPWIQARQRVLDLHADHLTRQVSATSFLVARAIFNFLALLFLSHHVNQHQLVPSNRMNAFKQATNLQ